MELLSVCWKRHDRGLLGDLRQGSRKWGFALHWMLSKSRGNSMNRYLHKSYLEGGKNRVRIKQWLVKSSNRSHGQDSGHLVFFMIWTMFMFLPVFRHNYRKVLLSS